MIECGIVHSGFSQGGLDSSTGEEREDTWSVRTDFAEIPYGLQTISTTVLVGRKIWKSKEQEYEYAESTTDTLRYVYFYDENKNFMGYIIRTKNNDSTIDFFNHLGAKYVRFAVHLSGTRLYPDVDDIPDTKSSYYYLQNFSANCVCLEWKLNENNKFIHEDLKIAPEKAMLKPYPKALWSADVNSATVTHKLFPNISEKAVSKPYPKALWRIRKGANFPCHELMPRFAFIGMGKLKYINIPESVRKIGKFAFSGTVLERVKIHPECEFFKTSFPENCIIEFYD
ncbi:MAG: leucine-rich repeat domain-containing protein [Ruminococcus sp.]|nr:leucine-rich repeat domain-containing protein [Ruminococcus sp.]